MFFSLAEIEKSVLLSQDSQVEVYGLVAKNVKCNARDEMLLGQGPEGNFRGAGILNPKSPNNRVVGLFQRNNQVERFGKI